MNRVPYHLTEGESALVKQIQQEFVDGFEVFNKIATKKKLTVYGGGYTKPTDKIYQDVAGICKNLREDGWIIMTGGGPGIMTAALHEEVDDGKENTVAFGIDIYSEAMKVDADIKMDFSHFAVRKYFLRQTSALLVAPGGLGTLDELMELLTLIKTGKCHKIPIYLYDSKFWEGMINWFKNTLIPRGVIYEEFLSFFTCVDSPEEVLERLAEV